MNLYYISSISLDVSFLLKIPSIRSKTIYSRGKASHNSISLTVNSQRSPFSTLCKFRIFICTEVEQMFPKSLNALQRYFFFITLKDEKKKLENLSPVCSFFFSRTLRNLRLVYIPALLMSSVSQPTRMDAYSSILKQNSVKL